MRTGTSVNDRTLMENLEYLMQRYETNLEEAEKALKEAEQGRDKCMERLSKARALLEHERERVGEQLPLDDKSPYAGLTLREAALRVIKEKVGQPVTFAEIIATLRAHGYPIGSRYPGRSLHAALIGVQDVEKVATGTYRWRNDDPSANNSAEAAVLERSVD